MSKIYEHHLYEPIKIYFEKEGYIVSSEVKNCDMVLTKDDDLIIIELKKSISLYLVYQALDRKKVTNHVYVALLYSERDKKTFTKFSNLMKVLDIGIILVNLDAIVNSVYIISVPKTTTQKRNKSREKLVNELDNRSGNYNISGINQTKLFTAYKEEALFVACILKNGPLRLKEIKEITKSDKTASILQNNYYNWFERVKRGVYTLTEAGINNIKKYDEITKSMLKILKEREKDD